MSEEMKEEAPLEEPTEPVELDHRIQQRPDEKVRVQHQVTLGDNESEIFCCRFSNDDNYVACGKP